MPIDRPAHDQLEISVLSRGYGESIVIHVGGGRWIIIDSLVTATGEAAALEYLKSIGVDAASAVEAVLLTHWHDDHVAGATELISACAAAIVGLTGILQQDEFKAFLRARGTPVEGKFGIGVTELLKVMGVIAATKRHFKWCAADKLIKEGRGAQPYRFEALSPSDEDYANFIADLPNWSLTSARVTAPRRNDASVAAVLGAAGEIMLFGADLEVSGPGSGWDAVMARVWQARGLASFFKIPHHGSVTGDHPATWTQALNNQVTAALTPWNRSTKLPKAADVSRILAHTADAHAAAKPGSTKSPRRMNAVERSIKEAAIEIRTIPPRVGHAQFRKVAGGAWIVDYLGTAACHLSEVLD